MQRIIKFRAFNKVSEIMYFPESTPGNYNHYFQIGTEGFWLYNKDGQLICSSDKGDVLMQYTGMKDKKGKEIYEGDIVQFISSEAHDYDPAYDFENYGSKPQTAVVRWSDDAYGFRMRIVSRFKIVIDMLEVIGNVHEHPHLLTPSQKGDVLNTMNTDPNAQAAQANQEVEQATSDAVQATEQNAQEQAMESAEEGSTEG